VGGFNVTGNVGIGTSLPQQLLDVRGRIQVSNGTNGGQLGVNAGGLAISSIGAAPVSFYYNTFANESVRIDGSGNVGVGTTSPVYQAQIYGTGQATAALTDAGNKGGSILLNTPAVNAGDGGALLIGASSAATPFAAIKGLLVDGAGNTTGSLAFSTRATTGATALTEQARITAAGLFQFNSGYGSVATAYGCRAWVNFDGTTNTGGFCTIRGSGNVTSVADNGTGDYTVNFTTALPDANYSLLNQFEWGNSAFGASGRVSTIVTLATGSCRVRTGFLNSTAVFQAEDVPTVCASIFR
jgi:hypothetical protein